MIQKEITEQSETHEELMLKLYTHSINFNLKPENEYIELQYFRLQVEALKSGPHHKPYEAMLNQALLYRLIFILLGSLFFFFGLFIYEQSINWLPYSFIFSTDLTAKNSALTICLLLSFAAFGMSLTVSPQNQALDLFAKRTKRKLNRIYNKQKFLIDLKKAKLLKDIFHDASDKVNEIKEEAKMLFSQITKSNLPDKKMVSKLYNEALLEANDHLHLIIKKFKKNGL